MQGTQFGPYRILSELGRGGMGAVYRAADPSGREVALKVLLARDLEPRILERFRREGEITASLVHPGIVRVHAAGVHDGRPYLVCEIIQGQPFDQAWPGLDLEARIRLLCDAGHALGYAHARGVVHRDVKPQNLLVSSTGAIKVVDFGIALASHEERLTHTQGYAGTLAYMAPEQFQGRAGRIDPRADVWALGVVLYEVLSGQLPFEASDPVRLFALISESRPDSPSSRNSDVWAGLDAVCLKAMATDRADRYRNGAEFAEDLARALAHDSTVAESRGTQRAVKDVARGARRYGPLLAAGVLLVGLVSAALVHEPTVPARAVGDPDLRRPQAVPRVNAGPKNAPPPTSSSRTTLIASHAFTSPRFNSKWARVRFVQWIDRGRFLAGAAGASPQLFLWNEGTVAKSWERTVRHACVSPDRRGFASGAKTRVAYWPELSSEAPKLFALKAVVRDIAFSPRGLLVGFGDDGLVELDLETGAELRSIDPGGIVFKVRVSPDGRWLFVAVDSKVKNTMTRLRLLNYETGEFVDDANFLEQPRMAFADTGATVAVGHFTRVEIRAYGEEGFSDKRLLAGRDVAPLSSRSAFATLAVMGAIAHSYTVQELAYWNGRVYSIADADADAKGKGRAKGKGELRVWDVATGEELWVIAFAKAEPRRLSVGPDGVLIFMSDDTIHLYPAD